MLQKRRNLRELSTVEKTLNHPQDHAVSHLLESHRLTMSHHPKDLVSHGLVIRCHTLIEQSRDMDQVDHPTILKNTEKGVITIPGRIKINRGVHLHTQAMGIHHQATTLQHIDKHVQDLSTLHNRRSTDPNVMMVGKALTGLEMMACTRMKPPLATNLEVPLGVISMRPLSVLAHGISTLHTRLEGQHHQVERHRHPRELLAFFALPHHRPRASNKIF